MWVVLLMCLNSNRVMAILLRPSCWTMGDVRIEDSSNSDGGVGTLGPPAGSVWIELKVGHEEANPKEGATNQDSFSPAVLGFGTQKRDHEPKCSKKKSTYS